MRRMSAALRLVITIALGSVVAAFTVVLVAPQLQQVVTAGEWSHTEVSLNETPTRSLVYDSRGNLMATWFRDNRSPIALEYVPYEVIEAIIAIEDADFYQHQGINLKAIGRSIVENVDAGGISQGGSTITQQLIKNLVLTDEQTIERKIQEASLAVRLEDQMTKDQILEAYLNTVFFGSGAYGVKAAAEVYFGLETANVPDEEAAVILEEGIGWPEAALLASLISNPTANDPTLNPETSRYQRSIVLQRLADLELITPEEAEEYNSTPIPTERQELTRPSENDFFLQEVRRLLLEDERFLGGGPDSREETLLGGGLRIYTSYDRRSQRMAEQARTQVLRGQDPNNPLVPYDYTMSIAAIDPANGAVRAMLGERRRVGNRDRNYNLALDGARQPGSSFKTFTLVAALREGIQTNDQVNGQGPCRFDNPSDPRGYDEFENFANSRGGVTTITSLTTSSSNCGYVRIADLAGLDKVIETTRLLGVDTSRMQEFRSLTLGAFEVTPMDMAEAYATIASGGIHHEPYFIERIEDRNGNVIYDRKDDPRYQGTRVISEEIACWTTQALAANVTGGTGTGASLPTQVSAGKTGTAEEFRDAWYVGFTPHLATAVWMGNPDTNEDQMLGIGGLGSVTGGSFPAQAFRVFNTAYHERLDPEPFPSCPGFARAGKFQKLEGDVPIGNSPCPADSIVLSINGERQACRPDVPDRAEPCGDSGFIDDNNQPVPLYCIERPTGGDDDGGDDDDGAADGDGGGGDGGGGDGGGADGGAADGGGDGGAGGGDGGDGGAADGGGGDGGGGDGGAADGDGGAADGGAADGGAADGGAADGGAADGGAADGGAADGGAADGGGGADGGADGGGGGGGGGGGDGGAADDGEADDSGL
ncbi:MAG: transglycosylase domain-containing protein [Acidimicrobiales bacterium]